MQKDWVLVTHISHTHTTEEVPSTVKCGPKIDQQNSLYYVIHLLSYSVHCNPIWGHEVGTPSLYFLFNKVCGGTQKLRFLTNFWVVLTQLF